MRPSTEITAFDGGTCNIGVAAAAAAVVVVVGAILTRVLSVCVCVVYLLAGGRVVYPLCNSRLHRFINARNTTLALTHASLNRAAESRWNAETMEGRGSWPRETRVAHSSGVAWNRGIFVEVKVEDRTSGAMFMVVTVSSR